MGHHESAKQANCFALLLPDYPGVDVALDDDKAIQQDGAQQHEHASTICQHNVARDHSRAAKERHPHLVRHKDNCPIHEEPAKHQNWPCSHFVGSSIQKFCHMLQASVTCCCHMLLSHAAAVTCRCHMLLPHAAAVTCCCYHMPLPYAAVTCPCHMLLPKPRRDQDSNSNTC